MERRVLLGRSQNVTYVRSEPGGAIIASQKHTLVGISWSPWVHAHYPASTLWSWERGEHGRAGEWWGGGVFGHDVASIMASYGVFYAYLVIWAEQHLLQLHEELNLQLRNAHSWMSYISILDAHFIHRFWWCLVS